MAIVVFVIIVLKSGSINKNLAIDYCAEKGIPFYYWSAKGSHFFVKDRSEFLSVKNRKELSIDMLL